MKTNRKISPDLKPKVNYITKTLLNESLNENFDNLHKLGVKIVIRGSIEKLDKSLKSKIINAQKKTEYCHQIQLILLFHMQIYL